MTRQMIEIAVLIAIVVVVFARLYQVLGQKRGSERPAQTAPTSPPMMGGGSGPARARAESVAPAVGDITAIMQADPNFEVQKFIAGARTAYERIVQAFARGDLEALRTLLSVRVYDLYARAIADRKASGGEGPELVRLRTAEVADASLEGDLARIGVRFEAELAEGENGIRDTKERWTFERNVRSKDPNWLLAGVAQG